MSTQNIQSEVQPVPAFDPLETERIWLENRRKAVGSSDTSSLFNEGYGCARRLVYDKRHTTPDYQRTPEENRLLEAGHQLEETIAREFIEDCNEKLTALNLPLFSKRRQPARVCKDCPDLAANIDRMIYGVTAESLYALFPTLRDTLGDDPGNGIMEVKSTNKFILHRAIGEGAPADWILQVQEQFAVFPNLRWGIAVVKARDTWETLPIPILPDQEMIAEIKRRATAIMDVVRIGQDLPPVLPDGDKRCAGCQFRKTCKGYVNEAYKAEEDGGVEYSTDDSPDFVDLVNDYKTAKFAADDATAVVDAIKESLKEAMGDREAVYIPSAQAKITYKTPKPSMTWDTKALNADHPELKDKYMKPKKASRTFTVRDAE